MHPSFRKKHVIKLLCRFCDSYVCRRGMKAVLLADTAVELYSTDSPISGSSSPSIPGPRSSAGLKFATSTPAHLSGVAPSPMIGVSPIESQQHGGEMAHSTDRRNGGAYSTMCVENMNGLWVGLLEKPREDYLTPGEAPHSALTSITMDKRFLNNMEYYVNFRKISSVGKSYSTKKCLCKICDVACTTCGNVLGYHVMLPCPSCLRSCNNGHLWIFNSNTVWAESRLNHSATEMLKWDSIPDATEQDSELDEWDKYFQDMECCR